MEPVLTLTEAAASTNRSRVTLRRYLDQGRFPHARRDETDPNRQWLIPVGDLEAAGARRLDNETPDIGGADLPVHVRLHIAEAIAQERAKALQEVTKLADALKAQAATISQLLDALMRDGK